MRHYTRFHCVRRHFTVSTTSLYVGGGADIFVGRRTGVTIGFDVGHVNAQLSNGKQTYSRLYFGYFFQPRHRSNRVTLAEAKEYRETTALLLEKERSQQAPNETGATQFAPTLFGNEAASV